MDKTVKNIGLSKQIENVCESVRIHINGVKEFHLYSPVMEMHIDLDRVMNDVHKLKRLIIKLETGRASEDNKSRQTEV